MPIIDSWYDTSTAIPGARWANAQYIDRFRRFLLGAANQLEITCESIKAAKSCYQSMVNNLNLRKIRSEIAVSRRGTTVTLVKLYPDRDYADVAYVITGHPFD